MLQGEKTDLCVSSKPDFSIWSGEYISLFRKVRIVGFILQDLLNEDTNFSSSLTYYTSLPVDAAAL